MLIIFEFDLVWFDLSFIHVAQSAYNTEFIFVPTSLVSLHIILVYIYQMENFIHCKALVVNTHENEPFHTKWHERFLLCYYLLKVLFCCWRWRCRCKMIYLCKCFSNYDISHTVLEFINYSTDSCTNGMRQIELKNKSHEKHVILQIRFA